MRSFVLSAAVLAALPAVAQRRQPVLMISVDGMRPDYVTHADEHHLRIPTLRRILAEGTHAEGVRGVFPTVTYPSHTTLVTGVWPDVHGIVNNQRFDPERKLGGAWYWYAGQIQVPTLWSAAHAAGLSTASVGWPVTVDSPEIDFNIPEYWRGASPGDAVNPDDRMLMDAVSRPAGEVARIAASTGKPYMMGNDTSLAGDETKTVYALEILKQHKPRFMTIHLSSLDEEQHLHGPFSAEANEDLEALDGMIARLVAQARANDPAAVVEVVSDHGFAAVEHTTNLYIPFLQAGLIETGVGAGGALTVKGWKAQPWILGCTAAIMLHDPADAATREQVRTLLDKLAADPANGIEAILSPEQVKALGGFHDAAFFVTLKEGWSTGAALSGPVAVATPGRGTHGYNPATTAAMRSSLFVSGRGIATGKDLGVIDMRQIAPMTAGLLGITLSAPAGQGTPALEVRAH